MAIHSSPWTVEMVRALPDDGNRYECVDGVLLVTPAPRSRHELVRGRLHGRLDRYLHDAGSGYRAFAGESEITWGEEKTYLQPDIYVVPESQMLGEWTGVRSVILTVEVLSPSSVEHDRETKRPVYQRHHVGTYWIVDLPARLVEVWRPGATAPDVVRDALRWQVRPDAPVLEIPLGEIFAGIPQ